MKFPNEVKIAISLTIDELPLGQQKFGFASKFLNDIYEGNHNFSANPLANKLFIKDSLFKMPQDPKIPIIMVGPGTGVVPFIGFLQEREMLKKTNPDTELGDAYLFFGCRKRTSDFIYQEEMAYHKSSHDLTDVFFAFSREEGQPRVYVQDLLRERKELIVDVLMNRKGNFYICGNTKMGMDVQNLLKEFIGHEVYTQVEKDKRIIKELWGG